jgi:predicted HTH domain antitoxin
VARVAVEIPEELRRELAVHLFREGRLSFGRTRELAGMTAWAFQVLLGSGGVPVYCGPREYDEDLATLKVAGRR